MTQSAVLAASASPGTTTGFKNRIINGNMTINQRGFSGSNSNNTYTLDRWIMKTSLDSKFTLSQSSTAPNNFTNSMLITSSSAYSVPSNAFYAIGQRIEGYNLADIGYGTSACKSTSLSFLVRSSLTGTFGGALTNAAGDASYPFTYTISSANTWTQISVSIPPVTFGTWVTDNSSCLQVWFGLGVGTDYSGTAGAWAAGNYFSATGATSVVGTNGATFYLTGVQLEVGTTATNFDFRDYGTELALCQRYLPNFSSYGVSGTPFCFGYWDGVNTGYFLFPFTVQTRVAPTGVIVASGTYTVNNPGVANPTMSTLLFGNASQSLGRCQFSVGSSGGSNGGSCYMNGNGQIYFEGCEL